MSVPSPSPRRSLVLKTRSPEETRLLAVSLGPILVPGDVLVLAGDLGAGKTTFVQGLAVGLGITDKVTSPTFILMKEYLGGRFPLMHLDVYRLGKVQDVIDLGYDEFLDPSYVVAVEWGDMVEALLPQEHLKVELMHDEGEARTITLTGKGESWALRMQQVTRMIGELRAASSETAHGQFATRFTPTDPAESDRN
ncbi:MAG: tRNA (adenosine(37)-N6)-threonylcarbamoyltransferase complex ATPase subunit type 1 TsaE [Actinomycetota bacterium]